MTGSGERILKTYAGTIKIIRTVFLLVGIGLLVAAGIFAERTSRFVGQAITTSGEVVELVRSRSSNSSSGTRNYTFKPRVRFTAPDGKVVEFLSNVGSNPPGFTIGEQVRVLYDRDDPTDALIDDFVSLWLIPLILSGIGLVFFTVGTVMAVLPWFADRRRQKLERFGNRITADIVGVQRRNLRINRQHAYRVEARWQDPRSSQTYRFFSENIWFDPTGYLTDETVPVLIDQANPKIYHMDVTSVLQVD